MTASNPCPDDSVLEDLVAGRLAWDLVEQWTAHIDTCANCQRGILTQPSLANLEAWLPELKHAKSDKPHLRQAIDKVKLLRGSTPLPGSHEADPHESQAAANPTAFTDDGFELLGTIGRGGMGVVYRARDKSLNRVVAIKTLAPELVIDPSARKRFLREARSAAAVTHPNVITVYTVSEKPPQPYLVMEYVEGISLQQQLDRGGTISIVNVVRIGRQLGAALTAAHSKGVIHRDIKPGNIILNAQAGKVMLGDFGLARVGGHSRLTRSGTIVGTPAFIAPETIESESSADHRADLFSLGAVLYAMCSGDSPFQTDSLLGTLHRVSSVDPAKLSDQAPHVPLWLSDVVMRLLAKNPNDRFQSAVDVCEALRRGPTENASSERTAAVNETKPLKTFPGTSSKSGSASSVRVRAKRKTVNPIAKYLGIAASILLPLGLAVFLLSNDGGRQQAGNEKPSQASGDAGPNKPIGRIASSEIAMKTDGNVEENVFIVIDEGQELIGAFDTLADAVDHLPSRATIQIRSNEAIDIEPCSIDGHGVTMMAAPGFTPSLHFEPDLEEEYESMIATEGSLKLVGLELRLPAHVDEETFSLIDVCDQGSLQLTDCRLVVEDMGYCLSGDSESTIDVVRCHLHAPRSAAAGLFNNDGGSTSLQESWVTGKVGFHLVGNLAHRLTLRNSRVICNLAFQIEADELEEEEVTHVSYIDGSVLFVTEALAAEDGEQLDLQSLREAIKFVGRQNTFAGILFPDDEPEQWRQWREYLLEHDSLYVQNPLGIDAKTISETIHGAAFPGFAFDAESNSARPIQLVD